MQQVQEFELAPKAKFVLKYQGKTYALRRPTIGEVELLDERQKAGASKLSDLVDYLSGLGLPPEVSRDFDSEQLFEVIEKLSSKKK